MYPFRATAVTRTRQTTDGVTDSSSCDIKSESKATIGISDVARRSTADCRIFDRLYRTFVFEPTRATSENDRVRPADLGLLPGDHGAADTAARANTYLDRALREVRCDVRDSVAPLCVLSFKAAATDLPKGSWKRFASDAADLRAKANPNSAKLPKRDHRDNPRHSSASARSTPTKAVAGPAVTTEQVAALLTFEIGKVFGDRAKNQSIDGALFMAMDRGDLMHFFRPSDSEMRRFVAVQHAQRQSAGIRSHDRPTAEARTPAHRKTY